MVGLIVQVTPIVVAYAITAIIIGAMALFIWMRRKMAGGLYFSILLAALSEWALSDALRWAAMDNASQMLFWGLSFVGVALVPPLWLLFSLDYSGSSLLLTPAKKAALFIIPAMTIVIISFGLFGVTWIGPWFGVHTIYSYLLMLSGIVVIYRTFRRSKKRRRLQAAILLVAAFLPLAYNVFHIFTFYTTPSPTQSVDLSPMVYCVMGLLIIWGVYKHHLFDIRPMAKDILIESMSGGVLVLDEECIVADMNPMARKMLDIGEGMINQPVDVVLSQRPGLIEWCREVGCGPREIMLDGPGGPRWIDMHAVFLRDDTGHVNGKVVTLWDITRRKMAEDKLQKYNDELQESEERWRRLIEYNPAGIIVHREGKIIYANEAVAGKIGMGSVKQIIGQPILNFVHPDYHETAISRIREGLEKDMPAMPVEEKFLLPDGSVINVEATTMPLVYMGKKALLTVIWDIENRKQAEEKLTVSLKEKELLLKEIHHRVKNNLQIISSLLSLQATGVTREDATRSLQESQNRIRSMALIHEKLYRSKDLASIDFKEYITSMIVSLRKSYVLMPRLKIDVDIDEIFLDIDTAIPCGLIVNELITNSLKYAFKDELEPVVWVSLHREGSVYELAVGDNGGGLPPGFDFRHTTSLGLQLVTTLTDQLNGAIELAPGKGTAFIITFKEKPIKDQ